MKTTIQTVKTDSFEMRYFRFGTPGRQVMVILPGLSIRSVMESADAVVDAYQLAATDFDIYLFDRRSVLPPVYRIEDMAADTAAAMEVLGLRDVCLFGVSQGGMISQVIAADHPDLVKAMVLGSTASRMPATQKTELDAWLPYAENGDAAGLTEAFASKVYSEEFFAKYRDLILAPAEGTTAEDLARFKILHRGSQSFDFYDRLTEISCPVLVIGARKDRVLEVQASEEMAAKLGCDLYIYEDYGHAVYDEAPDYLARVLAHFYSVLGKEEPRC